VRRARASHRPSRRAPRQEARHRPRGGLRPHAGVDAQPCGAQSRKTLPGGPRIGVLERCDDAGDVRRDQQVAAGRAARRHMCAGLERHIGRRAARPRACLCERRRLGMRPASRLCPATPDDATVGGYDHAPDIGIGGGPTATPLGERDRCADEPRVTGTGAAQMPMALSLSSIRLNDARVSSSRFFCSAIRAALIGASIFCCARICSSVRSAGHCST
jgi:hypothetical protein